MCCTYDGAFILSCIAHKLDLEAKMSAAASSTYVQNVILREHSMQGHPSCFFKGPDGFKQRKLS